MIKRAFISLALSLLVGFGQFGQAQARAEADPTRTKTPIRHLIVLMQENHTFDNYFGTYPGANGLPAGVKMPIDPQNLNAGYVEPWHLSNATITDLSHNAATFQEQYDNGKMDGFVSALNSRNENGRISMGYYDGTDIPYYWNLADNYVLFDNFFSSAKDGSGPNHMFWMTAASYPPLAHGQNLSDALAKVPTIFDRLQAAGVSWKFYVQNYDPTITYRNLAVQGNRESQVVWVPLLNFDRFIDDPTLSSHIVDLNQYYIDLNQGTLPAVAYIVPSGASEHPPENPAVGERFVKTLTQELMRSTSWTSSAFLLLYDDWGGWYDHVAPPQVDADGYGARVPGLLISPYAQKGFIDNTQLDFTSVLKFIEANWSIQPLTQRDANANNLLSAFNFDQPPRQAEFLSMTREQSTAVKKDPAGLIYLTYGLGSLLSALVLGFAFFQARRLTTSASEETA